MRLLASCFLTKEEKNKMSTIKNGKTVTKFPDGSDKQWKRRQLQLALDLHTIKLVKPTPQQNKLTLPKLYSQLVNILTPQNYANKNVNITRDKLKNVNISCRKNIDVTLMTICFRTLLY